MAGAISAGAYSSGVLDFLFQALDAWEREKRDKPGSVPDHTVVIKVISGASAGSITGALAMTALASGLKPTSYASDQDPTPVDGKKPVHGERQPFRYVLPALYTAWVKRPDMACADGLLATSDLKDGEEVVSLLNSTVLDKLERSIDDHRRTTGVCVRAGERGRENSIYCGSDTSLHDGFEPARGSL